MVLAAQKRTEERVAMSEAPLYNIIYKQWCAVVETCFEGSKRLLPVVQAAPLMLKS